MTTPGEPLLESHADHDPFSQFAAWYEDAAKAVAAPEAMAVATADAGARPSLRMVLLKSWDSQGFVFYTNYDSRKGGELAVNPAVSLLFYWEPLGRQVRIEGAAARTDGATSDEYFATRPRGSQLGARSSQQSRPVTDRSELERGVAEEAASFAGIAVPRPPWWGGVRVVPTSFEFWQHRVDRLHDRLRYTAGPDGWSMVRLQP